MVFLIFLCNTGEKTHQLDIFFLKIVHTCTFIFANFLFYLICSARSEILEFFFQSLLMDSDESFYLDFFFFYTLWNLKFTYNSKCWMADEMKMLQLILVHEHEIPTQKKNDFEAMTYFFFSANALLVSTF